MNKPSFLEARLDERSANQLLRKTVLNEGMIDFCSNDYLGIKTKKLLNRFITGNEDHGSGGSRLLSGNYPLVEKAEVMIADFHDGEGSLVFGSGYAANFGVISAVAQRGDTVLYDQFCHASIRDGVRLSLARSYPFSHNDIHDLEKKLKRAKGNVFVLTEAVFSMDGDRSPLADLVNLSRQHGAHMVVDEAHAIGVVGDQGEGLSQHLDVHHHVFARIYTFGKAAGCHGAVVVGGRKLREYLINFSRPFIYSTALPEISVKAIVGAYQLFPTMKEERNTLSRHIAKFQNARLAFEKWISDTPIQAVIVPGNDAAIGTAARLQASNLDVRAIRYPTVPKGKERLRVNLHAFNSDADLDVLIRQLSEAVS